MSGELPLETRSALAFPLFSRPTSLFIGHAAGILLCVVATTRFHGFWPWLYLAAAVLLLLARLACLIVVRRRLHAAGADRRAITILSSTRSYMGVGLAWSAMSGAFCFTCFLAARDGVDVVLAMTWALGTAAGIATRNAGTPRYALSQVSLWVAPQVAAAGLLGGWYLASAIMTTLYFFALCSIIRQHHKDLLALIVAERTHAALASRFDAALSNMSQGLALYDASGRLQVINTGFYVTFGLTPNRLAIGDTPAQVLHVCAQAGILKLDGAAVGAGSLEALAESAPLRGILDLSDGRSVAVMHQRLGDGGLIATYEDITQRRRSEAQIAFIAHHDTLTGLPNRALFGTRIDQAVEGLSRGERFGLICLDLDHFKAVNDTLGHGMGDRLLRAVTGRLRSCLRDGDLVARLGGDEFAVIVAGEDDPAGAGTIAGRMIDLVSQPYEIDGCSLVIGASAGVVLAPDDGATAETLLMHADLALYNAKAQGRGIACFFQPGLSERLEARRQLERDLRLALMRQEFELHYQPMVDPGSFAVAGFEAQLRWNHPLDGPVTPERFIPMAEECGLIVAIGDWVLRRACMDAASWPEEVTVAVNLSPAQLRDAGLLQGVLRALEHSGLPACRLEVEITEAAVLLDSAPTLDLVREIRELGVRVAFDDFGTGFASLSSLHHFPFDKIKIDRSFIQDLDRSPSARAIVQAIAGIGGALGLEITADGVETPGQLERLRLLGCTQVQGMLLSRPRPQRHVAEILYDLGSAGAPALASSMEVDHDSAIEPWREVGKSLRSGAGAQC